MWSKSRAGIFLLGSVFGSSTSYLLLSWDNYNWKVLQEEKEALSGSHEPEGSSDVRLHEGDLAATDDTLFKWVRGIIFLLCNTMAGTNIAR